MTAQKLLRFQCHEFDAHLHTVKDGLKPYYALTNVRKNHDWSSGKPRQTFQSDGETWQAVLDYDAQPIVPWSDPSYQLETAHLYRLYFVCEDETYDGERADRSQRVKGGTVTIRPRWPDMKKRDKKDSDGDGEWNGPVREVKGYMDLGKPYLDWEIQASNIDFERYPDLLADAVSAFGIPRRYVDSFHETSNITDAAVYVRLRRDCSGPIYAADGPIARMHAVLQADREGYRKHVEDNRDRPGDYVAAVVDDERAGKVIRGHRIGKEAKHYYMKDPDSYAPTEFGYHPKLEIGYQTSATDSTVYWERDGDLDRHDLRRELEEMLLNTLEWAGFDTTGGSEYFKDAYFKPDDLERRSLKLVDCPLPEIESEQEATIMRLWGTMNPESAAADVTDLLLSDGGEISPQDAADKTGYCYDTILRAVDRLEGFIRHTYGKLEIESDFAAQEMLKRVRASEKRFRQSIGAATMQVADDARNVATDALERWRRNYDAGLQKNRDDCIALLTPGVVADSREHAKEIAKEAYVAVCERYDSHHGIHIKIELADGTVIRWRDLKTQPFAGSTFDKQAFYQKSRTRQKLEQDRDELPRRLQRRNPTR